MNSFYSNKDPYKYTVNKKHHIAIPHYNSQFLTFTMINQVDKLSILNIQQELSNNSRVSSDDLNKNSILVSNIGDQRVLSMNPIIYGNSVCHANIGFLRQIPIYMNNKLNKRYIVQVTMGCDHRVLDGATVARFTSLWRDLSQNPTVAFLNMI